MSGAFAPRDLQPGDRLGGDYTCESALASGAFGAVYAARHDASGERVAVKCVLDDEDVVRFEIEARLLARLSHPRIPRVIDYFVEDGAAFLVMELVPGPDLRRVLLEHRRLAPPRAVQYALQVADALAYVHSEHIIHRDVKPQNLILGVDGVVLVDFGIAREYGDRDQGTIGIGTPRFMAPEVMGGGAVSPRSDVYGLAATLWTMIAGSPPSYAEAQRLSELADGVDAGIDDAVFAGLAPDPERRVQTIQAFAAALGASPEPVAGRSLVVLSDETALPDGVMGRIVRAAAGVFDAAAASIAVPDERGGLRYEAAWGAGADEIAGVTLAPGQGLAGAVLAGGDAEAIASCREDRRFAAQIAAASGYVPNTMALAPLKRDGAVVGVLSILDRRDGRPFGAPELVRLELFADVAAAALAAG